MDYIKCFCFGGVLCVLAQIIIDKTKLTPARILSAYVCSWVLLTALGLYEPLVLRFKCGATVPLTGFGYSLAKGVKNAVRDTGLLGAFTGGLTQTSGGICAAIFFSVIISLFFHGKPENL